MIKPVKCAKTRNDTFIWELGKKSYQFVSNKKDGAGFYMEQFRARTRFGAILRWNWRQWRARRKMKGEAKT